MRRKNGKIITSEEEFAVNFLFTGAALQYLEQYSSKSKEWWMEYISNVANKQYDDLKSEHPQKLEQMINAYAIVSKQS